MSSPHPSQQKSVPAAQHRPPAFWPLRKQDYGTRKQITTLVTQTMVTLNLNHVPVAHKRDLTHKGQVLESLEEQRNPTGAELAGGEEGPYISYLSQLMLAITPSYHLRSPSYCLQTFMIASSTCLPAHTHTHTISSYMQASNPSTNK